MQTEVAGHHAHSAASVGSLPSSAVVRQDLQSANELHLAISEAIAAVVNSTSTAITLGMIVTLDSASSCVDPRPSVGVEPRATPCAQQIGKLGQQIGYLRALLVGRARVPIYPEMLVVGFAGCRWPLMRAMSGSVEEGIHVVLLNFSSLRGAWGRSEAQRVAPRRVLISRIRPSSSYLLHVCVYNEYSRTFHTARFA